MAMPIQESIWGQKQHSYLNAFEKLKATYFNGDKDEVKAQTELRFVKV